MRVLTWIGLSLLAIGVVSGLGLALLVTNTSGPGGSYTQADGGVLLMLIFLAGIAIGVIGLLLLLVVGVYRLVRRPPALTEVPRSGDPDVPES
jgi:hypothetical protein